MPRDEHGNIIRTAKGAEVKPREPPIVQQVSQVQPANTVNELSPEQKRAYDILSIFKKLNGINKFVDLHIRNYDMATLERFISDPIRYSSELAEICYHFYAIHGFFRELIQYYVDPVLHRWTVNTKVTHTNFQRAIKKPERIEKDFITYVARVNQLNLGRWFKRILLRLHIEDVYYGYWLEDGDSTTIFELPTSWCKLSGKANGNWTYKIITTRISDRDIDETLPKELAKYVKRYKGKREDYPVPVEKSMCLKYNDGFSHIVPPFAYVVGLVLDLIKLKQLDILRSENDVVNLISMLVPTGDELDDIKFTDPIIKQYAEGITDLLGDASVLLPSPMELEVLPTSRSSAAERDSLKNGIDAFHEETNFPSFGSSNSLAELRRSIENAQSKVFTLLDQLSQVINLKMRYDGFGSYNGYAFELELLHINQFNSKETQEHLLKQAQFGAVSKFEIEAARGRNPAMVIGNHYMENVLFRDMFDSFTVPKSSYTQSGDDGDEAGRPTLSDDEISPAGEQTREGQNDPDNRNS